MTDAIKLKVDPVMRQDTQRVIVRVIRGWQDTDPGGCFVLRYGECMSVAELGILADAAEAYLSTLPPPAWKVRAYYRPNSEEFEAFEYPTEIEARQQAHYLITGGVRKVEIEAP